MKLNGAQKFMNLVVLACFGFLFLGLTHRAEAALCDDPLRNQDACYKMKSLRAQIDILDAQRDLLLVNYPLMVNVGDEIKVLVSEILKKSPNSHLEALNGLVSESEMMIAQAKSKDAAALGTSNNLKSKCMGCHAEQSPFSGFKWSEISSNNWDKTLIHCNNSKESSNPFLCKNMNGMRTMYSYYFNAKDSGVQTFGMTGVVASEIKRISADLASKNMVHGRADMLSEVSKNADEILALAKAGDSRAFEKSRSIVTSCMQCHK